jgi:ATP-binding cassette, subfamily B, beta-glucan exporter
MAASRSSGRAGQKSGGAGLGFSSRASSRPNIFTSLSSLDGGAKAGVAMPFVRLYLRVLALLKPQARLAVALAAGNIALAAAQFVEPVLFGRIIDALSGTLPTGLYAAVRSLAPLLGTWVAFGLFTIFAGGLVAWFADRLSHRRRNMVLADFFEHILQLPLAYHSGAHSGRQMKVLLSGTDTLWWLWVSFFREHFAAFVFIVLLLPTSLFLNWRLALPLIVLCIAFTALTVVVMHKAYALQREVERHYSDLAETAADALGNVAVVQSFARVELEVSGLRTVVDSLLRAQMPVLSWWAVASVLTRAGTTLTLLAILLVGTYLKLVGLATVGQIVSFMSMASLLISRLEQAVSFSNRLFEDAPKLTDFFAVLDTTPSVHDRPGAINPGRVRGLIDFNDISFTYDGERPAVSDLNFTAFPGDRIALVGPTGSGKSTALALLYRAFDPQTGCISIDGTDIRDLTLTGLRRNIGVVFQETLLFNRSIAENLRIGRPDASDSAMRDAAMRAQALEFIERNPQGFAAPVGERGRLLSGGERQRLAIARAILKDPPILILDEATSALDPLTEARLNMALDEVMRGRTTFVIAHRLSTIRNATRILVFRNGRIIETGTFDELYRSGGFFTELVGAQFAPGEVDRLEPSEIPAK